LVNDMVSLLHAYMLKDVNLEVNASSPPTLVTRTV
jgi:hypothetical protein